MKIIQEEYIVGRFKPSAKHPNRATFLGTLEKIFGKPSAPKKVDIILEHDKIVTGAQRAKHKSQAKKENPMPTTKDYLAHDDDDEDDESIDDAEPLPRFVASVFVFDFEEQIKNLLSDIGLFGDIDNLAVNPTDPLGRYVLPNGRLGELNSGSWYAEAYDKLIGSQSNHAGPPNFLCPLILYADKTGTTFQQRHTALSQ